MKNQNNFNNQHKSSKGSLHIQLIKNQNSTVDNTNDIFCYHCGSYNYHKAGRKKGKQRYKCTECGKRFIENLEYPEKIGYTTVHNSEDVWDALEIGLKVSDYRGRSHKLTCSYIHQDWFKAAIKKFIKYRASSIGYRRLESSLTSFNTFSCFLYNRTYIKCFADINRSVIIDYIDYLNQQKLNSSSRNQKLQDLAIFFETCIVNNWFNFQSYLIRKEDYQKAAKPLPRYIPEEVMYQLNQHLEALPETVLRMVLVIQECGLRVGELCQLPIDCLKQDAKGSWFIQFMRWKMNKEDTIPISVELAQVIQEQQQYIRDKLGEQYNYLFCGRLGGSCKEFIPKPNVMLDEAFVGYLKKLAEEFDIRDKSGKRWNFQSHQFRHTVGTRMINTGVPQHIVQRYLGHDSPHMTSVYAHIHDATLRKKIDEYLATKVVNINGEIIESLHPELDNDANLQWMKKKVLAETLPNGYCGLPAQLTCSKGNACLTCGDFRTTIEFLDQHKEHLERTNKVLEVAKASGWHRQIQVNEDVKKSLENIINTLESNKNE
ncbi:tyrosine-type recombinase/integrase [Fischerella sp. PCC 9605]|uniref:tyrosine-type recombinase/integrase n=1 Tax=Fischerella sp. PCC 9605 TaxID=1173024 RepID=UPI0004B9B565|nr:tyrosine-type recombinase/integrase [Fischerella sp. PCC 9605]